MARIGGRILFLAALLGVAALYYYGLGPGPTPSERSMELPWWRPAGWAQQLDWEALAPLQAIGDDYGVARHEGRMEWRGLIPFGLFALPVVLLTALGFRLFRSIWVRVPLAALALTLCAFVYYGWLDPETWRDYTWRWPIALFVTSLYLSAFAFAPAIAARVARSRALQATLALGFAASIYLLSTEVTGTNPFLEWNLSPWPVITLYGFLLFGLLLGVVHLAAGLGLAVRGRVGGSAGLALGVVVAAGFGALLSGIPFEQITAPRLALLALGAGTLVAAVGRRREDVRLAWPFLAAALLILGSIKAGQWQAESFQAEARDRIAPSVIAALDRYRTQRGTYPLELSELVPDYLPELPRPRVGWHRDPGEDFTYTDLGDSFLLEFSSVLWVQCAYSPPYREEDIAEEGEESDVAAGSEEDRMLEASWSCERKPPRLW
jgi:hypothetical protein